MGHDARLPHPLWVLTRTDHKGQPWVAYSTPPGLEAKGPQLLVFASMADAQEYRQIQAGKEKSPLGKIHEYEAQDLPMLSDVADLLATLAPDGVTSVCINPPPFASGTWRLADSDSILKWAQGVSGFPSEDILEWHEKANAAREWAGAYNSPPNLERDTDYDEFDKPSTQEGE